MMLTDVNRLTEQGSALVVRTTELLRSAQDDRIPLLAEKLSVAGLNEPLRLVVTGEYNAGKSTILQALTGRTDILVDSDVSTSEVTEYLWGSVLLVDTPGVKAGVREQHDELAEQALRDADLVLFVLTVDLFDDVTAEHLRHVAHGLGKRRQLLVAINKSATMKAPPGVRERAVREVLGSMGNDVPVVECDARRFLRSVQRQDTATAGRSGIPELSTQLSGLVTGRGEQGRVRRPFDAVAAVIADTEPFFGQDPAEDALRRLLARRRRVLLRSADRLDLALKSLYGHAEDRVERSGASVIDSVSPEGVVASESIDAFDIHYQEIAEKLASDIQETIEAEATRLDAELADVARGPLAQEVRELFGAAPNVESTTSVSGVADGLPRTRRAGSDWDPIVKELRGWALKQLRVVGQKGSRPGSPMHTLVLEAGHKLGVKFKPWGAVKVAKAANVAINVGLFAFEAYTTYQALGAEDRALEEAVHKTTERVRLAAVSMTQQADELVRPEIDGVYAGLLQEVADAEGEVDRVADARAALKASLLDVRGQAEGSLAELDRIEAGRASSELEKRTQK